MCDECRHGRNWPGSATSRANWTDPLILVTTAVELFGEAITGIGQLAGSMLKAHSNDIAVRQEFKAGIGAQIEALTSTEREEWL